MMDHVRAGFSHDPLTSDVLPGGWFGNHGIDVELDGLRPASCDTVEDVVTVRCRGGAGWHIDLLGHHKLYPRIDETVFVARWDDLEPDEERTLRAWCDEGVPVRLRGLVGDAPMLALDDGWRVVLLPRKTLQWWITPA